MAWGRELLCVCVVLAVFCGPAAADGKDDDWEEWGETEASRKAANQRRMVNRGAVPNIPPPPGMDTAEFVEGMANSMGGGQKLFFIKTDAKKVGDVEAGKRLAGKWSLMINNAGLDIQVFPMDNKQTIAQCPPWEIEQAKKFFLKQREVRELLIDNNTVKKKDVVFDDSDDDESDSDEYSDSDSDEEKEI